LEFTSSLLDGSVQDSQISVNNIEDVHKLSFVLMDSLYLDVIKCVKRNIIASVILNPLLELFLIVSLDCNDLLLEVCIRSIGSKLG
jgi:hypothetical protein